MAEAAWNGHGEQRGLIPLDVVDRASDSLDQDLTLSLLGNTSGALTQIEAALDRMDDGTYGQCEECGQEIPHARLEVLPHTPLCVECASRQERGDRVR